MRPRAVTSAVEAAPRGALFCAVPLRGRARAGILIADDDAAVRTELATCVRRQGCTVETATDLSAALQALARAEFDIVFADVQVAGGDDALLAQLRDLRPGTALVLMTAHATVAEAVHAMQSEPATIW
jgi:DNA-binding NtrC family response regulator